MNIIISMIKDPSILHCTNGCFHHHEHLPGKQPIRSEGYQGRYKWSRWYFTANRRRPGPAYPIVGRKPHLFFHSWFISQPASAMYRELLQARRAADQIRLHPISSNCCGPRCCWKRKGPLPCSLQTEEDNHWKKGHILFDVFFRIWLWRALTDSQVFIFPPGKDSVMDKTQHHPGWISDYTDRPVIIR